MVQKTKIAGFLVALVLAVAVLPARASLSTDLQSLVAQGSSLSSSLSMFSFTEQSCSDLGLVNQDIKGFVAAAEAVTAGLTDPLSASAADMDALDSLSGLTMEMAMNSGRLSLEIQEIDNVAELFEYRAALSAMLELSADIGTMADRILEMADRILAMADNIGTMAQRILISQQIQSANLALTQGALLSTQQNMVLLSQSLSSIVYNVTLGLVLSDSNNLLDDMAVLNFTSENMAVELETLEARSALMLNGVVDLYTWMSVMSQGASHYISGDTLTSLGDLSTLYTSLASSLEVYAATINNLAPLTDTIILSDATASMLRLTADIGLMAARIMEMTDKIIVMADNIGLMADTIVATQELQQANIDLTEASLLSAQNVTITVIKNMGL